MAFTKEISQFLEKSLKLVAKEIGKNAKDNLNVKIQKFLRVVFKQLIIVGLFAFAFFSLSMAILFAGIEYLNLTKTLSFLSLAIIILFIALILKSFNSKVD